MTMLSRRALLKADFNSSQQTVRLPWVRNNIEFLEACTRCHDCISKCPEEILIKGDGGFPEINFKRGECTFCTECVKSCSEDLFNPLDKEPWLLNANITEQCLVYQGIHCMVCREQCESEAISFIHKVGHPPSPILNQSLCNGCGACFKPCPGQAIKLSYQYNENDQQHNDQIKEKTS